MSRSAYDAYARMDPMNCILDPQGSCGGLYLGNIDAAQNVDMLLRHRIGAVLTVAARTNLKYDRYQMPNHEIFHVDDVETQDLSRYFGQIIDFITRNIATTNVFVHCFAGVSRSSTAVIVYLMKSKGWSYDRAFSHTKARRSVICPNRGFVRQMRVFERSLEEQRQQQQAQQYSNSRNYNSIDAMATRSPNNGRSLSKSYVFQEEDPSGFNSKTSFDLENRINQRSNSVVYPRPASSLIVARDPQSGSYAGVRSNNNYSASKDSRSYTNSPMNTIAGSRAFGSEQKDRTSYLTSSGRKTPVGFVRTFEQDFDDMNQSTGLSSSNSYSLPQSNRMLKSTGIPYSRLLGSGQDNTTKNTRDYSMNDYVNNLNLRNQVNGSSSYSVASPYEKSYSAQRRTANQDRVGSSLGYNYMTRSQHQPSPTYTSFVQNSNSPTPYSDFQVATRVDPFRYPY